MYQRGYRKRRAVMENVWAVRKNTRGDGDYDLQHLIKKQLARFISAPWVLCLADEVVEGS